MRALAVVMMIQGHTIDALLSPSLYLKGTLVYDAWQVGRGLTAPIFLFGSGFAYVFATARKTPNGVMGRGLFVKRLRWISVLFLVGSLMHFPASSFFGMAEASSTQWDMFYRIDVLRLMAVSLLGLLIILSLPSTRKRILPVSSGMMFLIIVATPFMHSIDWSLYLPRIIAAFLSMHTGSIFTLFPFTAYVFAGAAASSYYLGLQSIKRERRFIPTAALVGLFLAASAHLLHVTVGSSALTVASPGLFMLRLGLVLLLWSVFGLFMRSTTKLPSIVPVVGQHTLLIYVAHIVVLYGSPWFAGLTRLAGKDLSYLPVLMVIVSLLAGSILIAHTMERLRNHKFHVYRLVPYAGVALLFFVMTVM